MKSIRSSSAARKSRPSVEELEVRQVLTGIQPTAAEQLLLERLNDARADPGVYGSQIGLDLSGVAPSQPLAWSTQLVQTARGHALDMSNRGFFGHVTPDGAGVAQRLDLANIAYTSYGESLAGGTAQPGPVEALNALLVDANVAGLEHRQHLLAIDDIFKDQTQVGIGVVQNGSGPLKNYYAIETIAPTDARPFITGVVYRDTNYNGKYDVGEAVGNANITVSRDGNVISAGTTFESGGYSFQVDAGTFTVTVSGGGLASALTQTVTVLSNNVRLNFNAAQISNDMYAFTGYAGALYRDILGRTPSPNEAAYWANALKAGLNSDSVVFSFISSDEYSRRLVAGWYTQFLGRGPEDAALKSAARLLSNGTVAENTVLASILTSNEYYYRSGGTAQDFVKALYHDLLGRDISDTEANAWINLAANNDRASAVNGILSSAEYHTKEVVQFYHEFLGRAPDPDGQTLFVDQLNRGVDERVVIGQLATSTEYLNLARPALWVKQIYQDVLGRAPTDTELGTMLARFRDGTLPAILVSELANTAESHQRVVTQLYEQLLQREPDDFGKQAFTRWLQAGGPVTQVISDIVSSPEYFEKHGSNNSDYVRALYQDLLHRTAREDEVGYWAAQMDGGNTRYDVATVFANSPEFKQVYIQGLVLRFLHRSPNTPEQDRLVGQFTPTISYGSLVGVILAQTEYINMAGST